DDGNTDDYTLGTDTRMIIQSDGNVGIGTLDLTQKLEVAGTASISGQILMSDGSAATPVISFQNNPDTGLYLSTSTVIGVSVAGALKWQIAHNYITGNVSRSVFLRRGAGSNTTPSYVFGGDANTGMYSDTADKLQFATGGVERLTLLSNGNIGIGDTSPEEELTVTGNILASTSGDVDITLRSSSAIGDEGKFIIRSASSNDRLDILNNTTELMTIASTGFVGIGTTAPDELLHLYAIKPTI
ncbi:unnamed protein product, partial [marine sediment metagenome]